MKPAMRNLGLCVFLMLLCSCGGVDTDGAKTDGAKTYHYSVFVFESPHVEPEEGQGNPEICKFLFKETAALFYMGKRVGIPQTAVVCGVVVVTDGNTSAIVRLMTWTDEEGVKRYACNGPQPAFAHHGKSRAELIASIVKAVRK